MNETRFDMRALLSRCVLFGSMEPDELDQLLQFARFETIEAKQVAFHKGSHGNEMFAIAGGRVKISTFSLDGKEILFDILESGDVFGELSLLDGKERSASVTAIERCRLLVLEQRHFLLFLENNPRIGIKMLAALCERLRATNKTLEDACFLDLPARLAKKLLYLVRNRGTEKESRFLMEFKLSQEELGNLVGASRESINKQMRIWEDDDIIRTERGYIHILQPTYLEQTVNKYALQLTAWGAKKPDNL
ncbi:MAG: hypothetical protein AUK53_07410 [Betaproteobacteria bacterium CG2_30_59_46]|nr:MAG: hypothetical protein AUK53_07410 [Betaproteobacteria bacterium CG2_30_59_46]